MTETTTTGSTPATAPKPAAGADPTEAKAPETKAPETKAPETKAEETAKGPEQMPGEIGGPQGPEPTRFGDWEFKGRCSDF
ncbi:succinate dehydrogenase assembly factor 4 [Roseomonas genomospecies 6]|nr:succinate dehydrogenase assembly factor 4 [Roseomonas genomospecies 6]